MSLEESSGAFSGGAFEGVVGLEDLMELAADATMEGCSEGGPDDVDAMGATGAYTVSTGTMRGVSCSGSIVVQRRTPQLRVKSDQGLVLSQRKPSWSRRLTS